MRTRAGVSALACAILLGASHVLAADPFVQVRGSQLVFKGKPVRLKGTNYYPRDYMWGKMWDADPQIFARDALLVSKLDLNCVRILVPYTEGGWKGAKPPPERLTRLVQVVNTFGRRGVRSVVTLFDWETSFAEAGSQRETENVRHLTAVVERLKDNPYVLMWDVKNEPDHPANLDKKSDAWTCCPEKREKIVDWLRRMCNAVRGRDPNHPVAAGIRWAANAPDTLDFVDVAMFHSYWPNIGEVQIPTVLKAMGEKQKPLIVEEFGWPTHPTPCLRDGQTITDYTEQRQREMMEIHLKAFEQHNIAGCIQWMTFDAAKYNDNPKESFEKYFGLWRYDYTLKPGGELFAEQFKVTLFPAEAGSR
jgi:hypothetical protein